MFASLPALVTWARLVSVHLSPGKGTGSLAVPLIIYPHPTSLPLVSSLLPMYTINSFSIVLLRLFPPPGMHSLLLPASSSSTRLSTPGSASTSLIKPLLLVLAH